jgi:hypothetical protein
MQTGDSGPAVDPGDPAQPARPGEPPSPTPAEPPPAMPPVEPPPVTPPGEPPLPEPPSLASAAEPPSWPAAGTPSTIPQAWDATPPFGPGWGGRRTVLFIVGAVILVGGGAVAAIALLGGGSPGPGAGPAAAPSPTGLVVANIVATPVSPIEVDLTWTSTGTVQFFYLYRNGKEIITVAAGSTSYKDNKVAPNHTYTYGIEAADSAGHRSARVETMATSLPPPPLVDARLQGPFIVKARYVSETFTNKSVGQVETLGWKFTPTCPKGACKVRVNLYAPGQTPTFLARKGGDYDGTGAATIGRCGSTRVTESLTFAIHVTRARFIGGVWRATAIAGTFKQYSPASFSCAVGSAVQSLTGSLQA